MLFAVASKPLLKAPKMANKLARLERKSQMQVTMLSDQKAGDNTLRLIDQTKTKNTRAQNIRLLNKVYYGDSRSTNALSSDETLIVNGPLRAAEQSHKSRYELARKVDVLDVGTTLG